jgi:hypothetical protein
MPYEYRPRDPRGKLREIVVKYLTHMRVTGHQPNRGVAFDDQAAAAGQPQARGWLVADRRPAAKDGDRYLLLNDGDVWHAVRGGQERTSATLEARHAAGAEEACASAALDEAVTRWLTGPSDDLITLLAKSLADARIGGGGWLEDGEESVELVADRRAERAAHLGPERRGS